MVNPSMYSITMYQPRPSEISSWSVIRFGCEASSRARNSCLKRWIETASVSRIVLTATITPRFRSRAR